MEIDIRLTASERKHGAWRRKLKFDKPNSIMRGLVEVLEAKGFEVGFVHDGARDNETLFGTNASVGFEPESFTRYMLTNADRMKSFLREVNEACLMVRYYGTKPDHPVTAAPSMVVALPSRLVWKEMSDEQYVSAVQEILRRCADSARRYL